MNEIEKVVFELCGTRESIFFKAGVCLMALIKTGNDVNKTKSLTGKSFYWIYRVHDYLCTYKNKDGEIELPGELFDKETSDVQFVLMVMEIEGSIQRVKKTVAAAADAKDPK